MSLRIAYLTAIYPRATDTFIQREVGALRRHGVHIETFSLRTPAAKEIVGPEQQAELATTTHLIPPRPWKYLRAHAAMLVRNPVRYFKTLATSLFVRGPGIKSACLQWAYFAESAVVAHQMLRHGLSHMHTHFSSACGTVAMLAAQMAGRTFSMTIHGPADFFDAKFWRLDEKIRRSSFVACISHFCRSQCIVFAPQETWNRLHIVHCGVDPSLYTPVAHSGVGKRLLFVGRLAGVKGLPVLFDAVARLKQDHPQVQLTLAGDGPERPKLTELAASLGIAANVRFLGYQSQTQVRELLQQTDVFVMGSFAEGVPVVLMEAMAAGVPVVATQIAGIPELVDDGHSGFLVPAGDPVQLAERTDRLLRDPQLRAAFGAAGRERVVAEFDMDVEARRLQRILVAAIQEHAPLPVRPEPMPVAKLAKEEAASDAVEGAAPPERLRGWDAARMAG